MRKFIILILVITLGILMNSCGQMTAEDEGLDSKSIEEVSGSTAITTDDTTTDNTTTTDNSTESVKFVAVGNSGTILSSPEGTTWTSRTSGTSNNLNGIIYGNSIFVAVGNSGTILTSSDGTPWTSRTSGTSNGLFGVNQNL